MTEKSRAYVSVGLIVVLIGLVVFSKKSKLATLEPNVQIVSSVKRQKITNKELKKIVPVDSFTQIYPDPKFRNLNIPGSYGKYGADNTCGKIIRVLRFQNISRLVEARYGMLPKNLMLAMMVEESTGMDVFPNAKDDGGAGLNHMQPATAQEYGLKTYDGCDKMVCKKHGKQLRQAIEDENYDRKNLIAYDDRLHPIKNIDATARMIACGMQQEPIKGLTPLQSSIRRYSGKKNYAKYWLHIVANMAYLDDSATLTKIEIYFNRLNPDLQINGQKSGFKEYITVSQEQNLNYGLADYEKLPQYLIANSDTNAFARYVEPQKKKLKKLECE